MDVFRDFMYVPYILERRWSQLRSDMIRYGIQQPRLAITELQMFVHLAREAEGNAPAQLTRDNLVNPGTLAEALYDTLIYHVAVRLQPFVELVTHSATVNHGGGLRKERERVYANPCYYAQLLFAEFAAAKPVKVELNTAQEQAPVVLPDIKNSDGARTFGVVDALAAVTSSGDLLLSIVHRGTAGPVRLAIKVDGFATATRAEIRTLQSAVPWAANRLEKPRAVEPVRTEAVLRDGSMTLLLQPFSVTQAHLTSNN
jgi:alpha-N-arabinofuranosidase